MEAAAISALLPKLAALLTDEYKLQSGAKAAVKYIEDELSSMQAALEAVSRVPPAAAGHSNPNDGPLRLWAERLREIAYDAEDSVDSYMVRVSSTRQVSGLSPAAAACRYKARRRVAVEIERIKMEVQEESDRLKRFTIPEPALRSPPSVVRANDPRVPPLFHENQIRLVGMGRSTEELIRRLLPPSPPHGDGDTRLKVVAVVGAGGIGKTTLAREVYDKLQEKFDCRAFVPVSQRPNVKSVLGRILRQVSQASFNNDNHESWGEDEVIQKIRDVLEDKRVRVVLIGSRIVCVSPPPNR